LLDFLSFLDKTTDSVNNKIHTLLCSNDYIFNLKNKPDLKEFKNFFNKVEKIDDKFCDLVDLKNLS
jgi:hypothetical protein